jgi:hypothetical protein
VRTIPGQPRAGGGDALVQDDRAAAERTRALQRAADVPGREPATLHQAARKSALAAMFQAGERSRITFTA